MLPGDLIQPELDMGLVVLSFLISVLGCFVALMALSRMERQASRQWLGYILVAAIAYGGVGVWGMHFIAMTAQVMPIPVAYDAWSTIISLGVAVAGTALALWVFSFSFSLGLRCYLAGLLLSIASLAMHFIGVHATRMYGYFEWDTGRVAAACLLALVVIPFLLRLAWLATSTRQRLLIAACFAITINAMHHLAVSASTIVCTTPRALEGWLLNGDYLPYIVFFIAGVTLVVLGSELFLHRTQTGLAAGESRTFKKDPHASR